MLNKHFTSLIIFVIAVRQICQSNYAVLADNEHVSSVLGIADFALNYNPFECDQMEVNGLLSESKKITNDLDNIKYKFQKLKNQISKQVKEKYLKKIGKIIVKVNRIEKVITDIFELKNIADKKDISVRDKLITEFRYKFYWQILEDTREIYNNIWSNDNTQVDLIKNFTTNAQIAKHFCKIGKSQIQWYDGLIAILKVVTINCLIGRYIMDDFLNANSSLTWKNIGIKYLEDESAFSLLKMYNQTIAESRRYMSNNASTEIWTCDADYSEIDRYQDNKQESKYYELVAFQKYIFKEAQLDVLKCAKKCSTVERLDACGWLRDDLCTKTRLCPNDLVGCKQLNIKSQTTVKVCINNANSVSRYNYIVPDGKDLPSTCSKENLVKLQTLPIHCDLFGSWYLHDPSGEYSLLPYETTSYNCFNLCSNCECICPDKIYYISLNPVLAKANKNKIVTAAKLTVTNDTIHIQIKESKLGANGSVFNESNWSPISNNGNQNRVPITWNGIRTIDLTKVILQYRDRLLTGLKFEKYSINNRISLAVFSSKFEFRSGIISKSAGNYWKQETPKPADKEFKLEDVDVPTKSSRPNFYDSTDDQYVNFTISSLEKDGGQTTVPFIDTQPVRSNPPSLLSGAGLIHKGQEGYGGFISLKLYTFNIIPFIISGLEGKLCKEKKSFCLH